MKSPSDTMGWAARESAQTSRRAKQRTVLLVLPTNHPSLVAGVVRYAKEAAWSIDGFAQREELLPANWRGDGVLAHFGSLDIVDRRIGAFLKAAKVPAVAFEADGRTFSGPSIQIDHHAVAQTAAAHFLERGYKSFLCLHGSNAAPENRIGQSAFRECVNGAGHPCATFEWGGSTQGSRRQERLAPLLRNMEPPIAVWAVTDHLAVHAIDSALSAGLRVPNDVAVLGCGNDTTAAAFSEVPLSTIDVFEHAGYEAAALLGRMMDGAAPAERAVPVCPQEVISRASTDAMAASAPPVAAALGFLREHWHEAVRATDISKAAGVSVGGLFTAFRREIRKSPMTVLLELRLREAERMLSESDDKLEFIAVTCGFGTKSNFSRVFKKARGVSPQAWRKATREHGRHRMNSRADGFHELRRAA